MHDIRETDQTCHLEDGINDTVASNGLQEEHIHRRRRARGWSHQALPVRWRSETILNRYSTCGVCGTCERLYSQYSRASLFRALTHDQELKPSSERATKRWVSQQGIGVAMHYVPLTSAVLISARSTSSVAAGTVTRKGDYVPRLVRTSYRATLAHADTLLGRAIQASAKKSHLFCRAGQQCICSCPG